MPISTRTRFEVLKRDDFTCRYCGRKAPEVKLHVDHIVPVALGGTGEMFNLVAACADCNLGKAAKPLSNVVARPDTAELTREIKEAREFIQAREEFAEWREAAMREVYDHWESKWRGPRIPQGPWPNTIRKWLESFPPADIAEAIDKAMEKISGGGDTANPDDVGRYLHGIMRHKIAGTFEEPAEEEEEEPLVPFTPARQAQVDLWGALVPLVVRVGCPEAAWEQAKRLIVESGCDYEGMAVAFWEVFEDCSCERCTLVVAA